MTLPKQYQWLNQEPGPKMILEALKYYGEMEVSGSGNNPTIMAWARELAIHNQYKNDDTAWCGLFMAVVAKRAGKSYPFTNVGALWARNWEKFGVQTAKAMLGDILIFQRNGGGHVGLYVGEDSLAYHVLGGNQGNRVSIVRILKVRLVAARRPIYSIAQPSNVRQVFLQENGAISINEG
jgi:uncharacterized protein (TIGR02594 family)